MSAYKPIPLVYIAGPFRGKNAWEIERNIRRAEELALEVWQAGFPAICPHTNTRFFQGAAPDEVWLKGDLEILRRCDVVLLVEGWEASAGTRAEIAFADEHDITVLETLADLKLHLRGNDAVTL
jgi:nucleoside 2-deoxyribosyltransferase